MSQTDSCFSDENEYKNTYLFQFISISKKDCNFWNDSIMPMAVLFLLSLIEIWIIKKLQKRIKKMKNAHYQESYSIITLYLFRFTQMNQVLCVILNIFRSIFLGSYLNFRCLFYTQNSTFHWFYGIYNVFYRFLYQSTQYIFLFQIYEWLSMYYIIKS